MYLLWKIVRIWFIIKFYLVVYTIYNTFHELSNNHSAGGGVELRVVIRLVHGLSMKASL